MTERRTKRRYAHELYPHAEEGETRPLEVEVPYLYARAVGFDVEGTSWMDKSLDGPDFNRYCVDRVKILVCAQFEALIADALLQGLAGQEAWDYADGLMADVLTEKVWERAAHYGIDINQIKPYPCGPEPDHHDHLDPPDARGWQTVHWIAGRESDCPECTEEVPDGER